MLSNLVSIECVCNDQQLSEPKQSFWAYLVGTDSLHGYLARVSNAGCSQGFPARSPSPCPTIALEHHTPCLLICFGLTQPYYSFCMCFTCVGMASSIYSTSTLLPVCLCWHDTSHSFGIHLYCLCFFLFPHMREVETKRPTLLGI